MKRPSLIAPLIASLIAPLIITGLTAACVAGGCASHRRQSTAETLTHHTLTCAAARTDSQMLRTDTASLLRITRIFTESLTGGNAALSADCLVVTCHPPGSAPVRITLHALRAKAGAAAATRTHRSDTIIHHAGITQSTHTHRTDTLCAETATHSASQTLTESRTRGGRPLSTVIIVLIITAVITAAIAVVRRRKMHA